VFDLVVRGGTVVTPEGAFGADVAVEGGQVVQVGPELLGATAAEVDATGLHVFPGVVDPHVHFDEPGRTEWEGIATGSEALVAGGGTVFADMPLNNLPLTLDGAGFDVKRRAATGQARADFALWGGLTPDNLGALPELAARGAVGVKAFMSDSGLPEFPATDDLSLYEGMQIAAGLGLLVAVHAESEPLIRALTRRIRAAGGTTVRDYLRSRPVLAEVEAIQRACLFAAETGARLHVVHVSSGQGALAVAAARARGVDVTCETCPHYLLLDEEDVERLGAVAKCAPPLRSGGERDALWRALQEGAVAMLASDHSPAPPAMKGQPDFFDVWGGISGVQTTLPAVLGEGHHTRGLALESLAALCAAAPAARLGLTPAKGRIAPGWDADLALVDVDARWTLRADDLRYRHRQSPYVGRTFRGAVRRTLLRGQTVAVDGEPVGEPIGRLVTPQRGAG
jgi:allantoinase